MADAAHLLRAHHAPVVPYRADARAARPAEREHAHRVRIPQHARRAREPDYDGSPRTEQRGEQHADGPAHWHARRGRERDHDGAACAGEQDADGPAHRARERNHDGVPRTEQRAAGAGEQDADGPARHATRGPECFERIERTECAERAERAECPECPEYADERGRRTERAEHDVDERGRELDGGRRRGGAGEPAERRGGGCGCGCAAWGRRCGRFGRCGCVWVLRCERRGQAGRAFDEACLVLALALEEGGARSGFARLRMRGRGGREVQVIVRGVS
ncbi:hypothetical protein C8Q76DRAFT_70496 [Earliella scabrosa]|nr:hypothetical protein C8Q76DRAFT_70496 [Earliella scabrosa]